MRDPGAAASVRHAAGKYPARALYQTVLPPGVGKMGFSKRIALSTSVILIFFAFAVLFFVWASGTQRRTVDSLQSAMRAQFVISDLSEQLKAFNKRLQVLEALAETRGD